MIPDRLRSAIPSISRPRRRAGRSVPRSPLGLGVAVAMLLAFAACGGDSAGGSPEGGPGGPGGPPAVGVTRPVTRTIPEWDEYTGRLAAVDSVEVRARVTGFVDRVHFREGALVDRGDLLFTLDPRTFRAGLEEAEAQRQQERVRLELAQSELERIEPLIDLRAVSQEELDQRRQEVESARAALAAAEAEVRTAALDVEFARVVAPVAGRVGRARVTEGNLVTGGTGAATVLTTIVSLDPVQLYFTPDERTALTYLRRQRRATDGVPVEMRLGDETGFPHIGRLDFLDNQIDDETGTLLVRAVFDNPDGDLLPGLFGRVRLQAGPPVPRLLIPEAAISLDQTQEYVLVVGGDGTVERRVITTGRTADGMRVVLSGLEGDEQVVVEGLQRALPGTQVTAQPAGAGGAGGDGSAGEDGAGATGGPGGADAAAADEQPVEEGGAA